MASTTSPTMDRKESKSLEMVVMNSDYKLINNNDDAVAFSRDSFVLPKYKSKRLKTSDNNNEEEVVVKNKHLQGTTFALLFCVGLLAGFSNGIILWCIRKISEQQVRLIKFGDADWHLNLLYFTITMMGLCGGAAYLCTFSNASVLGSGMPEIKALLAGDFNSVEDYKRLVSIRAWLTRSAALIMVAGAGLSVGSVGPMVHISACAAYVLMRYVPEFGGILESPSLTKQVFAAAAAVGVTSVFNCPVGGLLFSVEVTTSFYLMTNYWKSFLAATTGSIMYHLVLSARGQGDNFTFFQIPSVDVPYHKWEIPIYVGMGVVFGFAALLYLKINQKWFLTVKKTTVAYPVTTAVLGGMVVAVLIFSVGAYSKNSVILAAIIRDTFTSGRIVDFSKYNDEENIDISRLVGILIMFCVRMFLVLLSTNLRVPAGLFFPMFTLGAIFGRFWGVSVQLICGNTANIYIQGYAMVGAVAFLSGVSQTISAAVIAVEMTGEINMLLPCLIAAVLASGISKMYGISIYDQGMINKGLESLQLLLLESGGFRAASDVIDDTVVFTARSCTVESLLVLLQKNLKQTSFPVVNNNNEMKLIGSITRHDVFLFLKQSFAKENLEHYIREKLPADCSAHDKRIIRLKKIAASPFKKITQKAFSGKEQQVSSKLDDEHPPIASQTLMKADHPDGSACDDDIEKGQINPNDVHISSINENNGDSSESLAGMVADDSRNLVIIGESMEPARSGDDFFVGRKKSDGEQKDIEKGLPTSASDVVQSNESAVPTEDKSSKKKDSIVRKFANAVIGKPVKPALTTDELKRNEPLVQALLSQRVDVVEEKIIVINAFPFTAHENTPMEHIYLMFDMLKVNCVFVVSESRHLQGMISKDALLVTLRKRVKQN